MKNLCIMVLKLLYVNNVNNYIIQQKLHVIIIFVLIQINIMIIINKIVVKLDFNVLNIINVYQNVIHVVHKNIVLDLLVKVYVNQDVIHLLVKHVLLMNIVLKVLVYHMHNVKYLKILGIDMILLLINVYLLYVKMLLIKLLPQEIMIKLNIK